MKKKLSICITSFNKPKQLSYLVNYLIKSISNKIQICIYDNNSDKETKKLLNILEKFDSVKIIMFKKNFGERFLIKKIQSTINTEYFIILAEDDFINLKLLEENIKYMDNNKNLDLIFSKTLIYDIIKKNYYLLNSNLKNRITYSPSTSNLNKLFKCNIHLSSVFFRNKSCLQKNIFSINQIDEQIFIMYLASIYNFIFFDQIGSSFTVDRESKSYFRKIDDELIYKSLKEDLTFLKKNVKDKKFFLCLSQFSKELHFNYLKNKSIIKREKIIRNIYKKIYIFFKTYMSFYDLNIFKKFYENYAKS